MCFYRTAVATFLYSLKVSTIAEQKSESTENDALACSCLTRDDRESRIEVYIQFVYESEILYV